jgi:hypothetical protein
MATKKRGKRSEKAEEKPRPESEAKKKLLKRVLERSKVMIEADAPNRSAAVEDIKFVNVPGGQWDKKMKDEREGRPCLEANTLRINGKRIINEIRANRPQGHVKAVEGGDKKGAELREGLVRNILNMSDFDSITDYEAEYQVDGGLGAWRVDTDYADDSMFDQDIIVNPIKNPLCLYWDPACKDILLKRDAADWLLIDRIPNAEYEAKYGDAEKFDFDAEHDLAVEDWEDDETTQVCEYWFKEPYDKELWLVEMPKKDGSVNEDGSPQMERLTVDSTSDEAVALIAQGVRPIKTRVVHCHKIMMCVASGKSILEGPVECAGSEFPFIVAHGEIKIVDGKVRWWGLHRFSKDAQQIQNVFWSAAAETVALAPKAHTWVTVDQAKGHLESYAEAHRRNIPIRVYNSDPNSPGPPHRHPGAEVPVAMLEMVGLSGELIRTTSGLHEESFGEESASKSGIAIARKQQQAGIVTYNFPDNMSKAAKRTGEIILDRIPVVYDAERELRVLGVDGAEDYVKVNQLVFDSKTGKTLRVDDLTSGKYDYYVKPGPSYSSMREEASEIYGQFVQKFPELMGVAGDLVFKASDLPYSDEIAKRLQTLLPPQIQQQLAEGKDLPPEVKAAMAQVEQAAKQLQQQGQLVQQAAQEVEQNKAQATADKAGVEKAIANLKTEEAKFQTMIANAKAELQKIQSDIAMRELKLEAREQSLGHEKERAEGTLNNANSVEQMLQSLDKLTAQFMEVTAQALQVASAKTQSLTQRPMGVKATRGPDGVLMGELQYADVPPQEPPKPQRKLKTARTKREGASTVAEIEFDDGSVERMRMGRQNGELVAIPEQPTVQ